MFFAFTSSTQHLYFLGTFLCDDIVFDNMAFFLAAVVVCLLLLVFRTTDRTLGPIQDKFQVRADLQKQADHYSGKKKHHTVKNNVVTEKRTKKVKVLSATCEGKKHDKKLADEQAIPFPIGSKVWKDTGFQGYEPEGVTTYQPMKKPKGKQLTTEQKQKNKELSRERIGVEHSIGGIKVFRIVHDIFRNFRTGFDDLVMETACGLHNWRLDFRLTA